MGFRTKRDIRYGSGLVEYTLTWREAFENVAASVRAVFVGGCPADYMSSELEDILCMADNPRLKVLMPLSDEQISQLSRVDERRLRKNPHSPEMIALYRQKN